MMTDGTPKRILITGGAGFIGTNLALRLLEQGHYVEIWDNFWTGRRENCQMLMRRFGSRIAWRDQDVRFRLPEMALDGGAFDQIYHLACPASPPHYQCRPIETTMTCVQGALNILELASRHQATVLLSSTSEVYGDALETPQREEYRGNVNCDGIRACYDEGKRCAESLFFDHHRVYGTAIRVVRIFNTYGPYMQIDDGRVVTNFIRQAFCNAPLTIYGKGEQTRSFCYCDDLVRGLDAMMNCEDKAFIGPVNLGNPGEFTVLELAEKILQRIPSASQLCYQPLPEDDPHLRRPDITLAATKLHWTPEISLDDGLERTIAFFTEELKNNPGLKNTCQYL